MIISLETLRVLRVLHECSGGGKSFGHYGIFNRCGRKVEIEIVKTSGGFVLNGGMLHEPGSNELIAE